MAGNMWAALAGLVVAATAASADAQGLKGYWEATVGTAAAPSLYFIVPDYSVNQFAVIAISCDPKRRTVEFVEDTGLDSRPSGKTVPVRIDGKVHPIPARAEFNEMDETWLRVGVAPYGSPAVKALVAARTLGLDTNPRVKTLPTARLAPSLARFVKACRLA